MGYIICPKCKDGCATQNPNKPNEIKCIVCGTFKIIEKKTLERLVKQLRTTYQSHELKRELKEDSLI